MKTVMMSRTLRSEAALRFAERRRREDEAPRLLDLVPSLATLRLEMRSVGGAVNAEARHARIVVVERAPALFAVKCDDPACRGGGYDVTGPIMQGLLAATTGFEVEDTCHGTVADAACGRSVRVRVTATYRDPPSSRRRGSADASRR